MKLTAKAVAALTLPAGKTDHFEWDDGLPGFGYRLRLAAGGKINRSWNLQYRHGGATRRLLLGSAAVLGAEQARVMAKKALGRVANGEDPQQHKLDRRGKDKHTFRATVADYLAIKQREVRPRTYTEQARYLTGPYFRPLHGLALDQITRKDVASRLNRISLESSSIVAAHARAQLSALFSLGARAWSMRSQSGRGHARAEGRPAARARAGGRRAGCNLARLRGRRSRPLRQATDPDRVPAAGDRRDVLERDGPRTRGVDAAGGTVQKRSRAYAAAAAGRARRHQGGAAHGEPRPTLRRSAPTASPGGRAARRRSNSVLGGEKLDRCTISAEASPPSWPISALCRT